MNVFCSRQSKIMLFSFIAFSLMLQNLVATQHAKFEQLTEDSFNQNKSFFAVRKGNDFCDDEKALVSTRMQQTKLTLETLFNRPLENDTVPCIGIAGSGGGYRAMISMLGLLMALEKYQLLDAITYMSTVSGSGWMTGTWIAQSYSLSDLKDFLRAQVSTDPSLQDFDWGSIAQQLFYKVNYGQPVNQSDAWGCFLAHVLLKGLAGGGQEVSFSSLAPKIRTGKYPLPILTALLDDSFPYEWFEFSPFEIGSATSAAWIPTQAFGKRFVQGISTDSGPEQTLGYVLGLSSSGFAAPLPALLNSLIQMLPQKCANFQSIFSNYFQNALNNVNELQLPPPTIFNYMKDLDGSQHASPDYLSFFDAGVSVNVGIPPLLRRKVQVHLICDASDSATNNSNNTLAQAQAYAHCNNFKFPDIDYSSIGTDKVSLFYSEQDPEVPVIIYFPNQVSFSTFKFQYTADEFNQLYRFMKDTVEQSYETICKGISIAIDNLIKIKNKNTVQ